jgi:hypothetical protein
VCAQAKGGVLAFPLSNDYNDQVSHWWYPVATVLGAWASLADAAAELPARVVGDADGAYVYDLVNVGREVRREEPRHSRGRCLF